MDEASLFNLLAKIGVRNLRRRGGEIGGSCPSGLHADNNPSWGMNLKEPHLHGCFSCNFRGTLQTLLVQVGKFNPVEAKIICGTLEEAPTVKASGLMDGFRKKDPQFFDGDEMYPYALTKKAIRYCEKRGIKRLTLEDAQVSYDRKQKRILFPWRYGKKLLAIVGRYIGSEEGQPKVRNYLITNNKRRFVYLPRARFFESPLVIVEGEFDALKVMQSKFDNVCAIGHAKISESQIKFLVDSPAPSFRVFTDDDIAGRRVAEELYDALSKYRKTDIVDYEPVRKEMRHSVGKLDPGMLSEAQIQQLLTAGSKIFRGLT